MLTCSNRKGTRRNKRGPTLLVLAGAFLFLLGSAVAQFYLPPPPPAQPSNYGKVILDSRASKPGSPGAVVFDHWLHRSKFTCRLCHVDIGFAMEAKATGVTPESNRQGFHCGACHDEKNCSTASRFLPRARKDLTKASATAAIQRERRACGNTTTNPLLQNSQRPTMASTGKRPRPKE